MTTPDTTSLIDTEAEAAMLGSMMVEPLCRATCRAIVLDPAALTLPAYRTAWRLMAEMDADKLPVDAVTMMNRAREQSALTKTVAPVTIDDLVGLVDSIPSAAHAEHYARIVWDLHCRRLAYSAAYRACGALLERRDETVQATVGSAVSELSRIVSGSMPRTETFHAVGEQVRIEVASGQHGRAYATGLRAFDSINALKPGRYIIVAARPSHGKTTLLLNIARHLAMAADRGCPVLFVTLEMRPADLYMVVTSQLQRVSRYLLERAQVTPEDMAMHIHSAGMRIPKDRLFFARCDTDAEIVAQAERMQREYGAAVVMVDYLQMVRPADKPKERSEYAEVSQVTRELARAARRLDITIIAASQLSRASEHRADGEPQMSDLRSSGQIEQDADVVAMLQRPCMTDKTEPPARLRIFTRKNRHGPIGNAELVFDTRQGRISDGAPSPDEPGANADDGSDGEPDPTPY